MEGNDEPFRKIFAELIHAKLGLYRSIAVKIVNSSADADDAVQAALLKAWNRRTSFQSNPAVFSAWICRIVVSESYDLLRKRVREERKLASLPENSGNNNADLEKLDSAIAELPELYRETVHIAILSGLSGEEAARSLGCSANTLYQRIHKAKTLLRETLRRRKNE